jgi:hypothetical protein
MVPTLGEVESPCANSIGSPPGLSLIVTEVGYDHLAQYVAAEKRARDLELISRLAPSLARIRQVEADEAKRARAEADACLQALECIGGFTSWVVNDKLLLLCVNQADRLELVDVTTSIQVGYVVDVSGTSVDACRPISNYNFRAVAATFSEASLENYELRTEGGEVLEINHSCLTHISCGWVAARICGNDDPSFKWFPLDKCCYVRYCKAMSL